MNDALSAFVLAYLPRTQNGFGLCPGMTRCPFCMRLLNIPAAFRILYHMSFISSHRVQYGILKYIKNVVQVESHIYKRDQVMMPLLVLAVAVHPAVLQIWPWASAWKISGKSLDIDARAARVRDSS
jgi:hypothetical protein